MTSAVESDVQEWYEDRVRDKLPGLLYKALNLSVYEPFSGYNQSYQRKNYGFGLWPMPKPTEDVEIDFVGHTRDVKQFTESGTVITFGVEQVTLRLSDCTVPDTNPPLLTKFTSPTKGPSSPSQLHVDTRDCCKYILAEITAGGLKSVLKKVQQLERGLTLLVAKATHSIGATTPSTVLDVAVLAILVCMKPLWTDIVKEVTGRSAGFDLYPLLRTLYDAGRFAFLHDGNSLSTVVRVTEERLLGVSEDIDIVRGELTLLSSDVIRLATAVKGVESKLDALIADQQSTNRHAVLSDHIKNWELYGYTEQEFEDLKLQIRELSK